MADENKKNTSNFYKPLNFMEKIGKKLKSMSELEQEHKLDHMPKSFSINLKNNKIHLFKKDLTL